MQRSIAAIKPPTLWTVWGYVAFMIFGLSIGGIALKGILNDQDISFLDKHFYLSLAIVIVLLFLNYLRKDNLAFFNDVGDFKPDFVYYTCFTIYFTFLSYLHLSVVNIAYLAIRNKPSIAYILQKYPMSEWRSSITYILKIHTVLLGFLIAAISCFSVVFSISLYYFYDTGLRGELNLFFRLTMGLAVATVAAGTLFRKPFSFISAVIIKYSIKKKHKIIQTLQYYLERLSMICRDFRLSNQQIDNELDINEKIIFLNNEINDLREVILSNKAYMQIASPTKEAEIIFAKIRNKETIIDPGIYHLPKITENITIYNIQCAKYLQKLEISK